MAAKKGFIRRLLDVVEGTPAKAEKAVATRTKKAVKAVKRTASPAKAKVTAKAKKTKKPRKAKK